MQMLPMFFVFAWYTLPVFAYIGVWVSSERTIRLPAMLLTIGCGYACILATVVTADAADRAALRSADQRRDGLQVAVERPLEAQRIMQSQGNDTGRALAPVLGIPLTALWYTLVYSLLFGGHWILRKLFIRPPIAPPQSLES